MSKAANQVEYTITYTKEGEDTRTLIRTFDCSDNSALLEALGWFTAAIEVGRFLGYVVASKDRWTRKEE